MGDDEEEEHDPLGPARPLLATALMLGARAEKTGDFAGCHALYACAARLARRVRGLSEVADFRLERALDDAENESEPAEQAQSLREGLESLVGDDDPATIPPLPKGDPLAISQALIAMAISIGAPAYNTGDKQGCFDVYACTARMLLASVSPPREAETRLREAIKRCEELEDADEQAWAMRHAFDAIADFGPGGEGIALREVRALVSVAISLGAPAFNLGDHRGCYEVYACTGRLLANSAAITQEIRDKVRMALEKACSIPNVTRQAWIMRECFDALLGAPEQPKAE